ncbi:MAG: hypothetical protein KKA84_14580 [Bacteroidetes bacterium]|nr:hypothetical protein [Bacteroidota bacterium]
MITEEEYYNTKFQRKLWLALFYLFVTPGILAFGIFIWNLLYPESYSGDKSSTLAILTINSFLPLIFLSLIGIVLFISGYKKSLVKLRVGIVFILIATTGFIPFAYEVVYSEWKNRPINYKELSIEELEERAEEEGDTYAKYLLKKNNDEKANAYYNNLDSGQLYALWKSNGDLKAFELIKRRFMMYKVERVKYSRISTSELQKLASKEKDSHAWFEIQSRKRIFANGGEEFF